jgi:hypothetical protein
VRLNAILGGFSPCVKIDILKVADRQVLAVWRFIIFRQQEGMHASAFLSEKQKTDL